ncbi:MAG: C69 family dipeptidase [Actinobacteria bacterium]|nr:C69 family dipeptidase [Actinomycetota bacterium]
MCDTLCAIGAGRTLFGKNSDRPVAEAQVAEVHRGRAGGGRLRTTHLDLGDAGAARLLGSRPTWMWGLEHGINEHRVAIGNEKLYTVDDPHAAEPGLLGMDLVRLGLERGRSADEALAHMTELLERHGQGGSGEADHDEPYFSSFLVADPTSAWVLETSARTWGARQVEDGAAISNRITLGADWTRASSDVAPGTDFDEWRDPGAPTGIADHRLAATRRCVATGAAALTPADVVATLRHHGDRPWGAPGGDPSDVSPPPTDVHDDWTGVTVCMHVRDYQVTNASMVAELPEDDGTPLRAWIALGSPCASIYVPTFPPTGVPPGLGDAATWSRFAALRDRVEGERGDDELAEIRSILGPLESELWEHADAVAGDPSSREAFVASAWDRLEPALEKLSV